MKTQTIILAVLVVAAIFVGAVLYGYIDLEELGLGDLAQTFNQEQNDAPPSAVRQSLSNREIHTALCYLTGKALPWAQTEPFIDSLHLELYGVNDMNYLQVETYYDSIWIPDGYAIYNEGYTYHAGYTTYSGVYLHPTTTDVRGLIAGSGASITSYYGYDCEIMVGHGPYTTWVAFVVFINSV